MANLQSARDNVAQALEPSLDELQRRLEERADHPLADALTDEYRQIRLSLDSWPQLVSAHVARQLWARIDTVRRLLDVIDGGRRDAPAEPLSLSAAAPAAAVAAGEQQEVPSPHGLSLVPRAPIEEAPPMFDDEEDDDSFGAGASSRTSAPRERPLRRTAKVAGLLPTRPARPITTDTYRVKPPASVDARLVMLTDPESAAAAAYRSLFLRIRARSSARSLMVTTVAAGEDGTLCAANLALAIADTVSEPVLLIEARAAKPKLGRLFSFEPRECFADRLAQHLRQPDASWPVAQLGDSNLHLLAVAESEQSAPPLDISALEDVVTRFASGVFAYVVVDGPATTLTSDGPYLARCAQGVVVAMHAGVTRQEAVRRAVQLLDGTPVLAYVLLER